MLDDAATSQSTELKQSRLYTELIARIDCTEVSQLTCFFDDVQQKLSAGLAVIGLFNYELGAAIHHISERSDAAPVLGYMYCRAADRRAW